MNSYDNLRPSGALAQDKKESGRVKKINKAVIYCRVPLLKIKKIAQSFMVGYQYLP